ncbi:hypothetical protein L1887_16318 [Cichorium endivia]|nr:hypothetical protein L1887_16318 [Cichorium endivia]
MYMILDFMTRPRLRVLWTLRPPATSGASTLKGISIANDSIQPQVPLRLPCYDFTPFEDPTMICANKTTKSLCGTSGTQKSWVIIGLMLRAKPIPKGLGTYSPRHADPPVSCLCSSSERLEDSKIGLFRLIEETEAY